MCRHIIGVEIDHDHTFCIFYDDDLSDFIKNSYYSIELFNHCPRCGEFIVHDERMIEKYYYV